MYKCGLMGGETLRLRRDLQLRTHPSDGDKVIGLFPSGSLWTVIGGDTATADCVWLINPNGDRHTWDHETIFDWFEVVSPTNRQ